jgi:hypothetical protein
MEADAATGVWFGVVGAGAVGGWAVEGWVVGDWASEGWASEGWASEAGANPPSIAAASSGRPTIFRVVDPNAIAHLVCTGAA